MQKLSFACFHSSPDLYSFARITIENNKRAIDGH